MDGERSFLTTDKLRNSEARFMRVYLPYQQDRTRMAGAFKSPSQEAQSLTESSTQGTPSLSPEQRMPEESRRIFGNSFKRTPEAYFLEVPRGMSASILNSVHPAKIEDSQSQYSQPQPDYRGESLDFYMKNLLKMFDDYEFEIQLELLPDELNEIIFDKLDGVPNIGNQDDYFRRSSDLEYIMREELQKTYNAISKKKELNEEEIVVILSDSLRKKIDTIVDSQGWISYGVNDSEFSSSQTQSQEVPESLQVLRGRYVDKVPPYGNLNHYIKEVDFAKNLADFHYYKEKRKESKEKMRLRYIESREVGSTGFEKFLLSKLYKDRSKDRSIGSQ